MRRVSLVHLTSEGSDVVTTVKGGHWVSDKQERFSLNYRFLSSAQPEGVSIRGTCDQLFFVLPAFFWRKAE